MTELRTKMIRAMELNNLSHHTQKSYLSGMGVGPREQSDIIDKTFKISVK